MLGVHVIALFSIVGLAFDMFIGVSAAPQQPAALARVVRSCTKDKVAALTFDDGPFDFTNDAVDILNKARAKGTFFVNGKNWGCIYDQNRVDTLKNMYNKGHQVASHTWSHANLTALSRDQLVSEMTKSHVAIQRITGASPAFMRPPYGNYNNQVREVAATLQETVTIWDLDSGDSIGKDIAYQKKQYDNAVSGKVKNVLSLQHDVKIDSVHTVLPYAIQKLQNAGYKLVTLAECLGEQPYSKVGPAQKRTGDWHC